MKPGSSEISDGADHTDTGGNFLLGIRNATTASIRLNSTQLISTSAGTVVGSFNSVGNFNGTFQEDDFSGGLIIADELVGSSLTSVEEWLAAITPS